MYKKIVLFPVVLYAYTYAVAEVTPWIEIKPSYFFLCASPMKNVYDHGGVEIQGSVSVPVCYVDLYGSIGYRHVKGNALTTGEKTNLTVIPIDIGLKPIFNFYERFYYFFAIGPRYFHFSQNNTSPYVDRNVKGNGCGLFVNSGFNVCLAEYFMMGVFGEYSYEQKKIRPTRPNVVSNGAVQLGGFAVGMSFGYAF